MNVFRVYCANAAQDSRQYGELMLNSAASPSAGSFVSARDAGNTCAFWLIEVVVVKKCLLGVNSIHLIVYYYYFSDHSVNSTQVNSIVGCFCFLYVCEVGWLSY